MSNIILILHNSYLKKKPPPPKKNPVWHPFCTHRVWFLVSQPLQEQHEATVPCVSLPCQPLHSKTGPVNSNHCHMPGTESLPLLLMPGALSLSPFGALMTACHLLFSGCSIYVCLLPHGTGRPQGQGTANPTPFPSSESSDRG